MKRSYAGEQFVPPCWSMLVKELGGAVHTMDSVFYVANRSILVEYFNRFADTLTRLLQRGACLPKALRNMVQELYHQQLVDLVRDSFRCVLASPGIASLTSSVSNKTLIQQVYRNAFTSLPGVTTPQRQQLQYIFDECILLYYTDPSPTSPLSPPPSSYVCIDRMGSLAQIRLAMPLDPAEYLDATYISEIRSLLLVSINYI